jgi:ABC-type Fe2+-enterobactin transport system substrate-binding protein
MISLQQLEAQYRALVAQMEESESAIARHDLDAVEACAHGVDKALAELAQASAQLRGLVIVPGEESAWNGLADAMRQAFTRAEQNREQIQRWIGQTQDILSQMSRGGQAVNGYSAIGMPDGAEFLSARG